MEAAEEEVAGACYERAARAILRADYLLIATGAGFSADSDLPVYADLAVRAASKP
jgi:hypothetical protein